MMSLLLGSVAASAILSGGPGGSFTDRQFDPASFSTQTVSNSNKTILNTTGATSRYVVSLFEMAPGDTRKYYWEFHCNPAGTAPTNFNGYQGVVASAQYNSGSLGPTANQHPIAQGSIGWRGNGTVWTSSSQLPGSVPTHGRGSVLMFAFEPSTGKFWIGKDGTWNRNPVTDTPNATSSQPDAGFKVGAQGRELNEGGTLVSLPGELLYPIPAGFVALSADLV